MVNSLVVIYNLELINNNTLGGIGFGIYVKNSSGSLERIAFTTDNEYVYVPSSDAGTSHVIVKAEYKSFKSNASNGDRNIC